MTPIGVDIGGANIKISDGAKRTRSIPFALWKNPDGLDAKLAELLSEFASEAPLAVTMTGELADCFSSRAEGVSRILHSVQRAAQGRNIAVWQTVGEFVTLEEAEEFPILTAASNWHALATWVGRMSPQGRALLIDIGSTTTDLIPLEEGVPMPVGRTDLERLQSGELQYAGVRRTPVCTLVSHVTLPRGTISLAREVFATTLDVALWRGEIPECREDCSTANGQPATREAAADRLARCLCADRSDFTDEELDQIASQIAECQRKMLLDGIRHVTEGGRIPDTVIVSGEGEFLARAVLENVTPSAPQQVFLLSQLLGSEHSVGACAYALSRLAMERGVPDACLMRSSSNF